MVHSLGRTAIIYLLFASALAADTPAFARGQAVLPFDSLEAYIGNLKSSLPGRNSQAFLAPAAAEAAAFTNAMRLLFDGHVSAASSAVDALNYDLLALADSRFGKTYWVLQERKAESGGFTQLHLANPGTEPATVLIELRGDEGELRSAPVARTVSGSGVLVESIDTLFPSAGHRATDYVRVLSDLPLVGSQLFGRTGQYLQVLNALNANGRAAALYSPQYVSWGASWRTVLTLVNLAAAPATVTLQLMADDGTALSGEREIQIPAHGKRRIEDAQFFGYDTQAWISGYVQIQSSNPHLEGCVIFGDGESSSYSTALPLVSELSEELVFAHLASDAVYYTGLALLNPSPVEAVVTLEVRNPDGQLLASGLVTLPPNERRCRLLTEYLPGLLGVEINGGYALLSASRPIAAIAVFGTSGNTAVSAIPAQRTPK